MKTPTFFKRRELVVILVLLSGLLLSSGWLQAQTFADQLSRKIRPEIQARLQALDREVAAQGYTFKVGYSRAMDKTLGQLCGLVKPKALPSFAPAAKAASLAGTASLDGATPSAFDWRDPALGGNTPVRDQGICGGCWAFGTVGPLEIAISTVCGRTENLSEQYLISCNELGYGCRGGWFAHDYHWNEVPYTKGETEAGAVLEVAHSYHASTGDACDGPHEHPYKLDSWGYLNGLTVSTPAAIKQAIYTNGPVGTSICTGPLFQAYASGVFNANETCSGTVNHAVTLVGWNDDLGPDNGYWILKNSWGPTWGEGGYMRVRYGTSMVGYGTSTIEFSQCPSGLPPALDCGHGPTIALWTTYTGQTNADALAKVSAYGCTSSAKNAPEKIYQVTTKAAGDLTVALTNQTTDFDVFILSDCDPTACKAFGSNKAVYANAPAGTYYVVVDGNDTNTIGTFDLTATSAPPPPTSVIIGDTVWHDSNGNGKQELSEPGISGVLLELYNGDLQPVRDAYGNLITAVTDADGHYQFQVCGKYTVPNLFYGVPGHEGEPKNFTVCDGVYTVHVASSNFSPPGPLSELVCSTSSSWFTKKVGDKNIYDLSSPSQYDFGYVEHSVISDGPSPLLGEAGLCTVFELNGGKVALSSGDTTGVIGDVCIGTNGKLSMSGGQIIDGQVLLASGATGPGTPTRISGGVVYDADLSDEINLALTLASSAAALPCDQTLASLVGVTTITPVHDGGQNVICVANFQVANNQTVTLTGAPGTSYIVNVTGTFKVNGGDAGGKVLVGGGVGRKDVLYNVIGTGTDVAFSGGGGGRIATIKAIVDGTILAPYRKITLNPGLVKGQIISTKDISLSGGAFVQSFPRPN